MVSQHRLAFELAQYLSRTAPLYDLSQVEISGAEDDRAYLIVRDKEAEMEISVRRLNKTTENKG